MASDHPGVGILSPTGGRGYRLKYTDPETGKVRRPVLPARMQGETAAAAKLRRDYAVRESKRLDRVKQRLEDDPDQRVRPMSVRDAADEFYSSRKTDRTAATYAEGCERFLSFLETRKPVVRKTDKIRSTHITRFNATLSSTDASANTRNKWRRSIKTMLRYWRRLEAVRLSSDTIMESLPAEAAESDPVECMSEKQIQKTLKAAIAHDGATYSMTRREKSGEAAKGGTLRYDPIAPFVLFMFLSGLRRGAALRLRWRDVDLEWKDRTGVVGCFYVRSSSSKTKRGRRVTLAVSPMLFKLLQRQKLRTGGHPDDRVFLDLTTDSVIKAQRRLRETYDAPVSFSWQECRRVCATFLVNSAIFPSPELQTSRHMGHSEKVLKANYADQRPDLDPNARTLEELYGIRKLGMQIVSAVSGPASSGESLRVVGKR